MPTEDELDKLSYQDLLELIYRRMEDTNRLIQRLNGRADAFVGELKEKYYARELVS